MSSIKQEKADAFLKRIQARRFLASSYSCCMERQSHNWDIIHHRLVDDRFFAVTCQHCNNTRLYYASELSKEDIEMEVK